MAGDPAIRLTDDERPGWSRLILTGRVTVAHARDLHATASAALARGIDVSVGCDGVEYLDTSALQILLSLGRDLVGRGKRFDLAGVSPELGEWLRLAGLGNAAGA